ncbi:MAG: ABC transporter-like protein [Planctomycetaceae bacterium]|mgnify:CR=1 FL=1|nr:ABC transporter-like protein [Planctomycetaceae bacterium]|tara:strand:+ start:765 stop:1709 length:945 start_codon:yes stop_codon:yes gene_type:complete
MSSPADSLISLKNVTKRYGRFLALNDITVELPKGVIGLLGPNGAGKSTLIKTLLGLASLTQGEAQILGYDVIPKNYGVIRRNIGYMPEDDCFIEGIAGVEMVQLAAQLTGYPPLHSLQRAHEVLDFCGTGQERYRQVETYSTGMRQKLKFAQAIVHSPQLLILDEPTSGLDPEERLAMLKRIELLGERTDMSVMICTHILKDIQQICDYAAVLVDGTIPVVETVENLRRPPTPSYQIIIAGNTEVFLEIAHQNNATSSVNQVGVITLACPNGLEEKTIWGWARKANVGIQSVVPAKVSMEDVFIQIVHGAQHGN